MCHPDPTCGGACLAAPRRGPRQPLSGWASAPALPPGPPRSGLSSVGRWLLRFLFLVSPARWFHGCLPGCSPASSTFVWRRVTLLWWLLPWLEGKSGRRAPLAAGPRVGASGYCSQHLSPLFWTLGMQPVTCCPPPPRVLLWGRGPNDSGDLFFFKLLIYLAVLSLSYSTNL